MKRVILFYLGEAKKIRFQILLLTLSEAISAISLAIAPLFLALLVDKITEGEWSFTDFLPLLLLIAAVEIIERLSVLLYYYAFERSTITAEKNIARRVFARLTQRSIGFHGDRLSGSLVADADKVTKGFSAFVSFVIEGMFSNLLYFIVMIAALATQGPWLAPIFALACLLLIFFGWKVRRTEAEPSLEESQSDSLVSAHLADTLGNIETVIASGEKEAELSFYQERVGDWEKDARKLMRKRGRNVTLVYSAPLLFILPILFLGVFLVTNEHLSAGALLLVLLYGQRIIGIANSSNMSFTNAIQTLSQAAPMVEILEEKIEIPDQSKEKIEIKDGKISLEKISFAYPDKDSLLSDFSLEIKARERVGLVGASGAGKSTLFRLLLRMLEPSGGGILFDEQDISFYEADSLRKQISYVAQDPVLFHRTIRENIAYGVQASDAEIREAARSAYASDFIDNLPDGYQSKVGDRGVKLSGGERQRIALARAFLRNTSVILLDEPTSSLDSYSEDLIQQATENLFQDKTVLVIAHRLSTIAHLDRIIVMDRGKIVEEGRHDDLVAGNGVYTRLWQKQSEGFLPEE